MISRELLNEAYSRLEAKQREIHAAILPQAAPVKAGWYNGHYQRDANGEWTRNAYPIPEVEVVGLCDIEIRWDRISVTTKLRWDAALAYPFDRLTAHGFEAYGVKDYLRDYYHPGRTIQEMKEDIRVSGEEEIGFSFTFPFETDGKEIAGAIKQLEEEGFYY